MNISGKEVLQPMAHGNEHHETQIVGLDFVVAHGQSAVRFVPANTAFYEVTFPALRLIAVDEHLAIAPARNHRYARLCDDEVAQVIVVVGPVRQQRLSLKCVANLARGQTQAPKLPGGINHDMQLGAAVAAPAPPCTGTPDHPGTRLHRTWART